MERLPGEGSTWRSGMSALRERHGVRAMLLEGGPTVLAAMLEAGLVDELFLSVSPLLVGGGEPSVVEGTALRAPGGESSSRCWRGGFLYLRYAIT